MKTTTPRTPGYAKPLTDKHRKAFYRTNGQDNAAGTAWILLAFILGLAWFGLAN